MDALFAALESSAFSQAIRDNFWYFPILESVHFTGLCLLFGAISAVDIRLLGFFPTVPIKSVLRLLPLAFVGLGINLVSGASMFATNPDRYWNNGAFRLKMAIIVIAGLNALLFAWLEARRPATAGPIDVPTPGMRAAAALSLLLWTSVILLGRLFGQLRDLFA